MNLYDIIADVYEEIFPTDPNRVRFCEDLLRNRLSSVIDVGCGTAGLARALAAGGFGVVASDLDSAMIEKAKRLATRERVGVELHVAGMLDTERIAAGRSFGLVTCLGNTLAHLESIEELEEFARQADAVSVAPPGGDPRKSPACTVSPAAGAFVVQLLNYDRILDERPKTLPPIEAGVYRFERHYQYLKGEIRFTGILVDARSGRRWQGGTTIRPFRPALVRDALEKRFSIVDCLADYAGTPAEADSFALLFVARRGGGSHKRPE